MTGIVVLLVVFSSLFATSSVSFTSNAFTATSLVSSTTFAFATTVGSFSMSSTLSSVTFSVAEPAPLCSAAVAAASRKAARFSRRL